MDILAASRPGGNVGHWSPPLPSPSSLHKSFCIPVPGADLSPPVTLLALNRKFFVDRYVFLAHQAWHSYHWRTRTPQNVHSHVDDLLKVFFSVVLHLSCMHLRCWLMSDFLCRQSQFRDFFHGLTSAGAQDRRPSLLGRDDWWQAMLIDSLWKVKSLSGASMYRAPLLGVCFHDCILSIPPDRRSG